MQTNMNFPTYVFATVNPGRAPKVVEELKRNSQIDLIAPVTGRYDLVLRLKANTPQNVYQTVNQIREISDIRTTTPHTSIENTIKQLSSIPGFVEACTVPGQFDIVALWQARTSEDIVKTSVEKVSNLEGIFHSETLLAYAPFFKA